MSLAGTGAFAPDHCANCGCPLPPQACRLYCSTWCSAEAKEVRYLRGVARGGRLNDADVQAAIWTRRIPALLAGGYRAALPSDKVRGLVWERDGSRCRSCGAPGAEIDHIAGPSADLDNLQLLCKLCHDAKTDANMVPTSPESNAYVDALLRDRVEPDEPVRLSDDHDKWKHVQPELRRERKRRLLKQLEQRGYRRRQFQGVSWAAMWDEILGPSPAPAGHVVGQRRTD